MLKKLGGIFAPKPSAGPHKKNLCLPVILLIRDRLKLALNGRDVKSVLMQRLVRIDGKVRTDSTYPVGFQDVVSIDRSNEHFRILIDPKGRFVLHSIPQKEASYKLCRIKKVVHCRRGLPIVVSHDARSLHVLEQHSKVNDTVVFNISSNTIMERLKFEAANLVVVTNGHNAGRIGLIITLDKHTGSYTTVIVRDAIGRNLMTRTCNVFVIGKGNEPKISLLKSKGVRWTILQEQKKLVKFQAMNGSTHVDIL
eukprot:gnl/MRDRNA2_/MRDRNA2_78328_c0_seq2.p1 gnl/MRDRNA2_/MRDRNA2_78328_c0~~gnl/MRDRNA2_/MRDRNA2_78328_c0_seq2.p1  ORF type:complete len:253 (+),score=-6.29 gnl/MRDRNA2_/MRDRNA2_78328_c0_seq2:63-821(+)